MDAKKKTIRNWLAVIVTVVFFAFQMYLALVKQLNPMLQSPLHLILALTLVFLYNPAEKAYRKKVTKAAEAEGKPVDEKKLNAHAWMNWFDIPLFICLAYMLWYVVSQNNRLLDFVSVQPVYGIDYIFMVMTIVLLLIAVYRTLGIVLTIFIAVFILYAFTSPYLPGILFTKGKTFAKFIKQFCVGMTMGESGVFGTPLYTSANTLFYFIVFGAFFSSMGGGQLLIDIGMKFSNKSSGGPAKAAVISSGLMGMISGSAVANVATTGVMTIPMMKKVGYEPEEAGAVEAVASTGGQIMPPIMGVGAFIMAEMLGVPYSRVAAAAILPAVAYYFAVFILVDRLAAKHQNAAQEQDAKIKVERTILPRLYLLLPAVILVVMIIRGASLMRAGMMGIVSCLICDVVSYFINEKKDFVDLKGIWNCCLDGAKQAAEIAIPTAACGIIINVVTGQTSGHQPFRPHQQPRHHQPVCRNAHRNDRLHAAGHGTAHRRRLSGRRHPLRSLPACSGHLRSVRQYVRLLLRHHGSDHASRLRGILHRSRYRRCERDEDRHQGLHLCNGRLPCSLCLCLQSRYPVGRHCR